MTKTPVTLTMPPKLRKEMEQVASETGFSLKEVIHQSMKLGLPKLRQHLLPERAAKPFTPSESQAAFAPDPEWERLEAVMARRPAAKPEED